MTTEEYLWDQIEKARRAKKEIDALPKTTPMLAEFCAFANRAIIKASREWEQYVTRK